MKQVEVSHPEFTDLQLLNPQLYNGGRHAGFQNKNPLHAVKDNYRMLRVQSKSSKTPDESYVWCSNLKTRAG